MKQRDPSALKGAFTLTEGVPHPNWKVVRKWVEAQRGGGDGAEAWSSFVDLWLQRLKEVLGRRYRSYQSEHFYLLSARSTDDAQALLDFSEMARKTILEALSGAASDPPSRRYVVLALANRDIYYKYISHYFPEGEYGGSGGIFLGGHCAHFVVHSDDLVRTQRVVAHELTHACLSHLPLPLWLNEGVTAIMEKSVFEESSFKLTRELVERHREFWKAQGLQSFWSGEAFYRPDEGQELSYNLAEIMVRNLLSDHREQFLEFLRNAHYADYGESAAEEILQTGLSDYAGMFLGEGDWAPRPMDAKSRTIRGCFYATKGKYDLAIADFTEAIRLDPADSAAYFYRGLAHHERGEWDRAIADATKAIRLSPKDARPYLLRHLAYTAKGELEKAKVDHAKTSRLAPNLTKEDLRFDLMEA